MYSSYNGNSFRRCTTERVEASNNVNELEEEVEEALGCEMERRLPRGGRDEPVSSHQASLIFSSKHSVDRSR